MPTTQLIVILVAVAAGTDPEDLAGLRLWHDALGITVALLSAGAAELLALRLEENRPPTKRNWPERRCRSRSGRYPRVDGRTLALHFVTTDESPK